MREENLKASVAMALERAATRLPDDVLAALKTARATEDSPTAVRELETILKNAELARKERLPICQDTGIPTFFVTAGAESPCLPIVEGAIAEAVRAATKSAPLRPNTVDPLTGENPGDNLGRGMPLIDWEIVPGDEISIDILLKGGGSENMSSLKLLLPSAGISGIKKAVVEHVAACGGLPCPPTIVGVGIGGGGMEALRLGKRALVRKIDSRHPVPAVAALEAELLELLNETGVGPMGLGGKTTVLSVHLEYAMHHPASLPVGIAIQCWADRRARVRISPDGRIEVN